MRPALLASLAAAAALAAPAASLLELRRIWDQAPHNAFTDLILYRGRWYCVFREGASHVSPDGAIRVLESRDTRAWQSAARLASATADLRDPKLVITADGRLMLTAAAALHQPAAARHQTLAWFSPDGREWTEPAEIGERDLWLWRVTWHGPAAYGVAYHTGGGGFTRLYASRDGTRFDTLVGRLFDRGYPSESALVFLPDGQALCLLRRDRGEATAQLGSARPPYTEWSWKDLGARLGGPNLIRLPDGRLIAAGRLHDGRVRTAVCRLDVDSGKLSEILALPSGGDTSYPGLVWHDGRLWVSYYSSHEGKASIYLASVKLP